jgi:Uma2 family endonuclease
MATIISEQRYTPDELLRMPDGARYELVNGQLVENTMSGLACWIAAIVVRHLMNFVADDELGVVFTSETQYQCFPDDPRRIRKPDVSFIHRDRFSPAVMHGFIRIAPDLAVEVVSDNDLYYEVEIKVQEYLQAGVRLVWVLNPATNSIRVFRSQGEFYNVVEGQDLTGDDVLPGFTVPVVKLFKQPRG